MKHLKDKYGSYALITGASSGIGKEFAHQLAAMGFDLVLVARRQDMLTQLSRELEETFRVTTCVLALDLSTAGAISMLAQQTERLPIGLVVLNAGVSTAGTFIKNDLEAEMRLIRVNLAVPVQMTHHYGKLMAERRRGGIIFVSSSVGQAAVPYLANYAATKAYIFSFAQALNYELKSHGVDVTVLTPGPTKTEGFYATEGIDFSKLPIPPMPVERVVKAALGALGNKAVVFPGFVNKAMDFIGKYATPRVIQRTMFGKLVSKAVDKRNL